MPSIRARANLQHMDITPEIDESNEFSGTKHESLDDVVNRVNGKIRQGQLEGRLITIETLQCDAGLDWSVDPDVSLSFFSSKSVFILRIFYEQGPACEEEIGSWRRHTSITVCLLNNARPISLSFLSKRGYR